ERRGKTRKDGAKRAKGSLKDLAKEIWGLRGLQDRVVTRAWGGPTYMFLPL
ncbi:MAG: hypothetical protein ACI9AF_001547, partial [Granulosicoccus sp.]